jgi:hypothetical protein
MFKEVALEALVERDGARGTRTLTAFRPEDFKSPQSLKRLLRLLYELFSLFNTGDFAKAFNQLFVKRPLVS